MKKIVYISIIAALSIIMFSAVVSAGDNGWKRFHGVYEMISNGTCLHSSLGYTNSIPPFIPRTGSDVYVGTTMTQATWTFKSNGEGTFSFINYVTILPGGSIGPLATQNENFDIPFTFDVTKYGEITVYSGGIELTGRISIDHKTITLGSANQIQDFTGIGLGYAICNTGRVLIRVQ
jgi:hypothetical protein